MEHREPIELKREADGKYGFDGDWQRLCKCGHTLGVHAAQNDTGKRPCFNGDFDPATGQGVPGATGEDCDCPHFRPSGKHAPQPTAQAGEACPECGGKYLPSCGDPRHPAPPKEYLKAHEPYEGSSVDFGSHRKPKAAPPTHDPIPPDGCNCASFWTIRGKHKSDCPLAAPTPSAEEACMHLSPLEGGTCPVHGVQPCPPTLSARKAIKRILIDRYGLDNGSGHMQLPPSEHEHDEVVKAIVGGMSIKCLHCGRGLLEGEVCSCNSLALQAKAADERFEAAIGPDATRVEVDGFYATADQVNAAVQVANNLRAEARQRWYEGGTR